jgi:hypothetical protein
MLFLSAHDLIHETFEAMENGSPRLGFQSLEQGSCALLKTTVHLSHGSPIFPDPRGPGDRQAGRPSELPTKETDSVTTTCPPRIWYLGDVKTWRCLRHRLKNDTSPRNGCCTATCRLPDVNPLKPKQLKELCSPQLAKEQLPVNARELVDSFGSIAHHRSTMRFRPLKQAYLGGAAW